MLRTNLFVLTARSNNSGLSQQQNIVVLCLPRNLQPSLIHLKWVVRSAHTPESGSSLSAVRCLTALRLDPESGAVTVVDAILKCSLQSAPFLKQTSAVSVQY